MEIMIHSITTNVMIVAYSIIVTLSSDSLAGFYVNRGFSPSVMTEVVRGLTAEELSKSMIWYTTPMQQRSKNRFICDWLSATAYRLRITPCGVHITK